MKTINTYLFTELSKEVQKELTEKMMQQASEYDFELFFDDIKNDFSEELKNTGFHVEDNEIFFDVSYCHGSGASFDGYVNLQEYIKNNAVNYTKREIKIIGKLIEEGLIEEDVKIENNSFANHYCHEKTRYIDNIEIDYNFGHGDTLNRLFDSLIHDMESDRLALCNVLYNHADKINTWVSSEEYALDTLQNDDFKHYTESGVLV